MDFFHSSRNVRIDIPVTIGTHGVKADDNPADDIQHRPLYSRGKEASEAETLNTRPSALGRAIDDEDDELGEIDTSLFERRLSSKRQKGPFLPSLNAQVHFYRI